MDFSPELHRKMAGMGWTGLLVPEAHGGLGLGMLDMAVVLEEIGRAVVPGPFLFSAVLTHSGSYPRRDSGAEKKAWLPRFASGEAIGTLAFLEEGDRLDAEGVSLKAEKTRNGYTLSGTKMFVPFAAVADVLLVVARTEEGVSLLLVERGTPGLTIKPLDITDQTKRVYELEFKKCRRP